MTRPDIELATRPFLEDIKTTTEQYLPPVVRADRAVMDRFIPCDVELNTNIKILFYYQILYILRLIYEY